MASFAYEPSLAELIALSRSVELKLNQVSLSDSSNFTDPETELIKASLFLMIKHEAYSSAYNQTLVQIDKLESKARDPLPAREKGYRLAWPSVWMVLRVMIAVILILAAFGEHESWLAYTLLPALLVLFVFTIYRDLRYSSHSDIDAELNKRHAHLELLTNALNKPIDINSSIADLTVFKPYDPN